MLTLRLPLAHMSDLVLQCEPGAPEDTLRTTEKILAAQCGDEPPESCSLRLTAYPLFAARNEFWWDGRAIRARRDVDAVRIGIVSGKNLDDSKKILLARRLLWAMLLPRLMSDDCWMIHGAAAAMRNDGLMFCGPSGIGKSTAVRRLSSRWRVIADDCLLMVRRNGRYFLQGMPTWSLWSEGKNNGIRRYDCHSSMELRRIFLLEHGLTGRFPLGLEQARLGIAPSFTDMLRWHTASLAECDRRILAWQYIRELTALLPVERLRLNLNQEFESQLQRSGLHEIRRRVKEWCYESTQR